MEQDRCGASCLGRAAIAGVSTTVGMTVGASQHVGITAGRKADRFRWGSAWQRKREQIRQRDNNLCQLCLRWMPGTIAQLTYDGLSVHHAVSLEEDYDRRLDDDNLLTVCGLHHKMADRGEIPLADVLRVIEEQEEKARRYPPGGGW